jgi:hypothetical protein
LLLQLLTTGLKADNTRLLRDLLLELLYTVNKMLKQVENMPDHGLFVRAQVRTGSDTATLGIRRLPRDGADAFLLCACCNQNSKLSRVAK